MKCMDGSYYLFRLYFNYWQVLITTLNYRYVLSFSWCMFAGSKLSRGKNILKQYSIAIPN
uniref:Uncharacterized protein n=1 Tax=Anguilla anguilla TaxID=7936 RepID=A0A0E9WLC0_ANGAN